jgi:hypothetical protein
VTVPLIVWDIIGKVNKKAKMRQNLHTGKNFLSNLAKHKSILYENGADFLTVCKLL